MNTLLLWIGFHVFIFALLLFDLGVVQRKNKDMSGGTALWVSLGYVLLALLFGAGVFYFEGSQAGLEFLTGYFIEKSLSVDNIFVFLLIFLHFSVSKANQRRILFWGILGALAMRATLIVAGASAIATFHWLLYVFGILLIVSGIKMLVTINQEPDLSRNRIARFMRSHFRVTEDFEGEKFWVRRDGLLYMTPLFMVLVIVEVSDVIFAIDSIPAILAISKDTFIVYSSNVFAILGLRALYFALAGVIHRFHYLKYGLSFV
ncbi:MAG: TerC/Alx family metal homeostasis membrane protein, partial [Desulfomicrobium sp.]|nr:TerC/Alx family metal homeostasis membrane protein [Desulfomicrobium sp.]